MKCFFYILYDLLQFNNKKTRINIKNSYYLFDLYIFGLKTRFSAVIIPNFDS